jgi:hypothetical protein
MVEKREREGGRKRSLPHGRQEREGEKQKGRRELGTNCLTHEYLGVHFIFKP